ncbi:MAG: amidohydrolase family protein [Oscillospiraceae bacterium]|nr:amidohydrolase family protein [Oscillospiraceae bacterium]
MLYECHGHIMMDGRSYKDAADRHRSGPDEAAVRQALSDLAGAGVGYFRDGGDPFGVSLMAKELAPEYGIEYVSCAFAIHKKGCYGSIVGKAYSDLAEYRALLKKAAEMGAQYIKIMLSGLIDFETYGKITGTARDREHIRDITTAAHDMGFAVMVHVNGAEAVRDAADCGVDSVEHGCYADSEAVDAMRCGDVVWVPTLAAINAFCGREGVSPGVPERIIQAHMEAVCMAARAGVRIACGSDSGAVGVPHGPGTVRERELLGKAGLADADIDAASEEIRRRFRR